MYAYLIRRMLWMIPTFIGILVINFGILRLRAPTLYEAMAEATQGGGGGELSADNLTSSVENYLIRFRRTGADLPALVNLRAYADKDDVLHILRRIERGGGDELKQSVRMNLRTNLWTMGRLYVEPLAEILADEELREYHGPASRAFSLVAYRPLAPEEIQGGRFDAVVIRAINERNEQLKDLHIAYQNLPDQGYVITDSDEEYRRKRAALLELYHANEGRWSRGLWDYTGAVVVETGFVDFVVKLATLNLYSESRQENVFALIGDRWYVTFWLQIISIAIAWAVSIPLGIRSARRRGSLEDQVTTNSLFMLWSLPSFFVGTLFLYHLCTDHSTAGGAVDKAPFPAAGLSSGDSLWMTTPEYLMDLAWHAFLPLVVLSYASFTALSRFMRGNMLDQLGSDYVRTAKAKGASEDRVIYGHALRNSMITMITLGSGLLAELFGGFVIVELIWSIPGLGTLMLDAARNNDAPLLMAATIISVLLLLVGILIADILYAVVDPRIRSRYG